MRFRHGRTLKPIQIALQKRKELTKGDFRTKHSNWGHLLLGIGVLIAVEGPVNTYLRAGQHLLSRSAGFRLLCCVYTWLHYESLRQHLHQFAMLSCIHTHPCCTLQSAKKVAVVLCCVICRALGSCPHQLPACREAVPRSSPVCWSSHRSAVGHCSLLGARHVEGQ